MHDFTKSFCKPNAAAENRGGENNVFQVGNSEESHYWLSQVGHYSARGRRLERLAAIAASGSIAAGFLGLVVVAGLLLAAAVGCALSALHAANEVDAAMTLLEWTLAAPTRSEVRA
ncbi:MULTISPECIES: hypothetical protein [Bifidobacterium]|uniref:Uncharacterized protein n=1 Tax=Bifidobacterium eulemuris TaxID=1765219 RepID=A0A7L9SQR5_9BIFI|nr:MULTISPECIES: hypothetical protein [Bifidobacterium]QOL32249.1 hypothetical protein BE0216_07120 [Bifidobacterium eulemuris]QOL35209.1 hypothetical protein BL8807_04985 [Bifidobacterium lemurum]